MTLVLKSRSRLCLLRGVVLIATTTAVAFIGCVPAPSASAQSGVSTSAVVSPRVASAGGYWLVGSDGGLFAFGDAGYYGSVPADHVSVGNIVGMAATADGHGYWLVGSDGGLFAFGDAAFYGSMGGHRLARPVVAMAPTPPSAAPPEPTPSIRGQFNAVACPSVSMCVAVGQAGTNESSALIEVSVDGGAAFTDEPVPFGSPALEAVSCPDVAHCYAVGGTSILSTDDGGSRWTTLDVGVPMTGVSCQGPIVCAAVGWRTFEGGGSTTYWEYTQNGETWMPGTVDLAGNLAVRVTCGPDLCVAVGENIDTSANGGISWQFQTVAGGSQALSDVACLPGNPATCLAIGPSTSGTAELVTSTDGGVTWTNDTSNMPPSSSGALAFLSCAQSACHGIGLPTTSGGAPLLLDTANAGATWTFGSGPSGFTHGNSSDVLTPIGISCPTGLDCTIVGADASGPVVWNSTENGVSGHKAL